MSKTSQSIKMLKILSSRDKVSILELAYLLDTNPRNIPEYRMVLEEAGYIINSTRGPNGGYSLEKDSILPVPQLTGVQKQALFNGLAYLKARKDFMDIKQYELAMQNILSATAIKEQTEEVQVVNKFPLTMSVEEIEERYLTLEKAIKENKKVEIEYLSLKNENTKRVIHPYKLFMFNNAWFVLANDENTKQIKYFKINRIKNYSLLNLNFRVSFAYNEKDFIDDYGLKQNGEWFSIKLKFANQYAMLVAERIYGKDQTIEVVDKNTAILSCKMQNKEDIKNFVLSFGNNCEVLEPQWLINDITDECKNLIKKYK